MVYPMSREHLVYCPEETITLSYAVCMMFSLAFEPESLNPFLIHMIYSISTSYEAKYLYDMISIHWKKIPLLLPMNYSTPNSYELFHSL